MSNELMYIPWPGWEKVRKIGEGSFGTVYEIKHDLIKGEERAALKVLSIPRNESEIKSMRAEGQDVESITQTIKDQAGNVEAEYKSMLELEGAPNIVRCNGVYSNAHKDGLGYDIYIMMEMLTPLLDQVNNLIETESHIVQFGIDMCHALVACEKKGILHRDIKPENVFVSRDGIFKLGDFGVARSLDHTTYATKGVGTAPYMAPEIANGNEYNKQADIYSLGIMLYWLLNKRRTPFLPLPPEGIRTSDRENAFRRRCDGEQIPEPVDGSKELKRIVLKACAFNLADRYQSAQDMLEDLQGLMDPVPVRMIPRIIKTDAKEKTVSPWEYTDGPNRQSSSDEGHIPTRGPDEEWLEKQKKQKELVQQKKRQQLFKIIAGVIGAAFVILLILLLLRSCSGDVPQGTDDTTPSESTVDTIPVESSTEETIPPELLAWSDWVFEDELPDYVTEESYVIETQPVYRSIQVIDTTTSTTEESMDGWEMYHTESVGNYGDWSDWSPDQPEEKDGREIEDATCWRSIKKETTQSNSSKKSGWTLYDTSYVEGDYPDEWEESLEPKYNSDSRIVKTKVQYNYCSYVVIGYTDYVWSDEWYDEKIEKTELVDYQTREVYPYYYFYCWNCKNNGKDSRWPYWDGNCGQCGTYMEDDYFVIKWFTSPWSNSTPWNHEKYYQIIEGSTYWNWTDGAPKTQYKYGTRTAVQGPSNEWLGWRDEKLSNRPDLYEDTRTVYLYKDRKQVPVYHFWRTTGSWSKWEPAEIFEKKDLYVEKKLCYKYRDQVTENTYHFRKWSDWEDNWTTDEIVPSDTVKVEEGMQYRYKLRVE